MIVVCVKLEVGVPILELFDLQKQLLFSLNGAKLNLVKFLSVRELCLGKSGLMLLFDEVNCLF